MKKRMKVVRVSKTVELDFTPTVEEFQKYLDEWYDKMTEKNDE